MPRKKAAKKTNQEPAVEPKFKGQTFALSIERVGGFWSCVVYHLVDGVVAQRTVLEPTQKAMAIERFKVQAARLFMG